MPFPTKETIDKAKTGLQKMWPAIEEALRGVVNEFDDNGNKA